MEMSPELLSRVLWVVVIDPLAYERTIIAVPPTLTVKVWAVESASRFAENDPPLGLRMNSVPCVVTFCVNVCVPVQVLALVKLIDRPEDPFDKDVPFKAADTVTVPEEAETEIPFPATRDVTPELLIVKLLIVMPVPAVSDWFTQLVPL